MSIQIKADSLLPNPAEILSPRECFAIASLSMTLLGGMSGIKIQPLFMLDNKDDIYKIMKRLKKVSSFYLMSIAPMQGAMTLSKKKQNIFILLLHR